MRDDEQPRHFGNELSSLEIRHIYSPHTSSHQAPHAWVHSVSSRGWCRAYFRSPHTRGNKVDGAVWSAVDRPAARTRVGIRPGIFERSSEFTAMSRSRSLCTKRPLYSADYSPRSTLPDVYRGLFCLNLSCVSPEGRVPRRQAITAVSAQPTLGFAGWFAPPHPQRLPLGMVQLCSTTYSGRSDRKATGSA